VDVHDVARNAETKGEFVRRGLDEVDE